MIRMGSSYGWYAIQISWKSSLIQMTSSLAMKGLSNIWYVWVLLLKPAMWQFMHEESMMDRAASAGFEGIAQMLLEQKKLMDALEAENRELRRQLAELRRGVGIAVVIDGKTIQLASDQGNSMQMSVQSQSTLQ